MQQDSLLMVNTDSLIPLTHSTAIPRCQCSILSSLEVWKRLKGGSRDFQSPPCADLAELFSKSGQFSSFHTEHWIDLLPRGSPPQCKVNPLSIQNTTSMEGCGGRMRHKLPLRGLFPCAGYTDGERESESGAFMGGTSICVELLNCVWCYAGLIIMYYYWFSLIEIEKVDAN